MTAKNHILNYKTKPLLEYVPREIYQEYFKVISNNGKIYLIVIESENGEGKLYMECPEEKIGEVDGIVRAFFKKEDLIQYADSVSLVEKLPKQYVKRWELTFQEFVAHIIKMDKRYRESGKSGVRAVGSAVLEDTFLNLGTIWTKEQNLWC